MTSIQLPLSLSTVDPLLALRAKWSMPSEADERYGVKFVDYRSAQSDVLYLLDRVEQLQSALEVG